MSETERQKAERLVGVIREYWTDHGYPGIKAWAEDVMIPIRPHSTMGFTVIRSNIGPSGYPPNSIGNQKIKCVVANAKAPEGPRAHQPE